MVSERALRTSARSAPRLTGLDAARALAIAGMVIVNVGAATEPEGTEAVLVRLLHGRAAILFIVLAGVGVTLLARSITAKGKPLWPTLHWRAGLLLVLGLSLQLFPAGVNVILTLYAGLLLAALVALRFSARGLLCGAVSTALIGPVVHIVLGTETDLPAVPAAFGQNPLDVATSVIFTGQFPLIVWLAPFLFGMWLGRLDLGAPRTRRMLVVLGTIAAGAASLVSRVLMRIFGEPDPDTLGFDHLLLASGHSEMPLWLISAAGSAAAIIGLMLMITPKLGQADLPLIAAGQLALTTYAAHLVAIVVFVRPESSDPNQSLSVSLLIIAGLVVFSTAWRTVAARGPLEALLRPPPLSKR